MRITKLSVKDFRRYREFEVPLAPGLTIIHGPNEAGKTTIQRALELILTRKATSNAAEMDGSRSWDASLGSRPVIAIDFEIEDEEKGIQRGSIEKAFRGAKGTVKLEIGGPGITDPTPPRHAAAGATGTPRARLPGGGGADRHPGGGVLPLDSIDPTPRAGRSRSGRSRPP